MKIISKRAKQKIGLMGYKSKQTVDVGFFYCPYIPIINLAPPLATDAVTKSYVDSTSVQDPIDSQLPLFRER